jgi:hypothetical protein
MIIDELKPLATPIDTLIQDPANARKHDDRNIEALMASLQKFGQRQPIVVQQQGRVVRAGNARVTAARRLGWTEIAAVFVDEDDVVATAYAIADNRTAELAEWENEDLARLLGAMDKELRDFTGFSDEDFQNLLAEIEPVREIDEDEVPEPPAEPVSKLGQIWQLGRHLVYCGDNAATPEDWAFNAIVSDPPYGVNYTGTVTPGLAQSATFRPNQRSVIVPVFGDDKPFDPAYVITLCDGDVLLWGADHYYEKLPPGGSWIVWDKRASVEQDAIPGAPFEVCWSRRKQERRFIRVPWGGWHNKEDGEDRRWHPTQKPLAVILSVLESAKGETVLDPFLGSGTTLIAAEQLGRTCYGIEIEPRYVDVTIERWQNLTGEKATLIDKGEGHDER